MKKYLKSILLGAVLAVGTAVASATADNIKIGFNVPLTGFAAADGQSALHGAELAVKQVINGEKINNKEAIANPDSLKFFENLQQLKL